MKVKLSRPSAITSEIELELHLDALTACAPEFQAIRERAGTVPLRWLEPGYAGLVWVVLGQQISVSAARAILARLEALLGTVTPATVRAATDEDLRAVGLSSQKTRTLREIAAAIEAGLDLDALAQVEAEEATAALREIRGVGRWTAEVYLLFAAGHPDIFPAGDLALQESARLAFNLPVRPTEKELFARAERWKPHRGAAARLLWAFYAAAKAGRDGTPV